jgi:hypothetical protein
MASAPSPATAALLSRFRKPPAMVRQSSGFVLGTGIEVHRNTAAPPSPFVRFGNLECATARGRHPAHPLISAPLIRSRCLPPSPLTHTSRRPLSDTEPAWQLLGGHAGCDGYWLFHDGPACTPLLAETATLAQVQQADCRLGPPRSGFGKRTGQRAGAGSGSGSGWTANG